MEKITRKREGYHKTIVEELNLSAVRTEEERKSIEQSATVRYNMFIMHEVLCNLRKKHSKGFMTLKIRESNIENGIIARTKIEKASKDTKMDEGCFTGTTRLEIPYCEAIIKKKSSALYNYEKELPNLRYEVVKIVEGFKSREYIEDKNLEKFIHYCCNGFSSNKYIPTVELRDYRILCCGIDCLEPKDFAIADTAALKKYIKFAKQSLTLAEAELIKKQRENKK